MEKVIVTYRLKPGVTLADYQKWSSTVDQQVTPGQHPIIRFEVYAVIATADGEEYCDVFEDIEITSWEEWTAALAGEDMTYCSSTLLEHYAIPETLRTIRGERIRPGVAAGVHPPLPELSTAAG